MDQPVRAAFCPLYFAANGGTFTPAGLPILDNENPVRGLCDIAFDCGVCGHLHAWLARIEKDWSPGWECDACVKVTYRTDPKGRVLTGFYQSGRDQEDDPHEHLPGFDNSDPDNPPLAGCTRCGWQTSLLQLVLRPKT